MQSIKSLMTPLVVAAVMGLGFGFGFSPKANADLTCAQQCNVEFQECLAEGSYPGFYRCKMWRAACLRAC
jgi:hypothetical protein